jgi:hypothetical protein
MLMFDQYINCELIGSIVQNAVKYPGRWAANCVVLQQNSVDPWALTAILVSRPPLIKYPKNHYNCFQRVSSKRLARIMQKSIIEGNEEKWIDLLQY